MKIAVFEAEKWEEEAFQGLSASHDVTFCDAALDRRTASARGSAEIISTFVNSRLGADVLDHFSALKMIATRSTGFDHIDLDWCAAHGVKVANVPDYGDSTVAEHVFTLLLSVARHVVEASARTRSGNFSQSGLRGFELCDKTFGVIGTGRIGRRAIEIALGFRMNVIAYDLYPDQEWAERAGVRYGSLDAVLAASDVLTLHVPSRPETANLISDREFGLMKPGAVLINTARGSVVDVPALVRALADGKLRAAGLDVLPQEPLIREEAQIFRADADEASGDQHDLKALVANHVLLRFPNVLVTPHNAYNTYSAVRRIIGTTLENIEGFVSGRPQNIVSRG